MTAQTLSGDDDETVLRMPVAVGLCGSPGVLRAGVLGTLVDTAAGFRAIIDAAPDWIATADLTIRSPSIAAQGALIARAVTLRKRRHSIVIDTAVIDEASGVTVAHSMLTFALLGERREPTAEMSPQGEIPPRSSHRSPMQDSSRPLSVRTPCRSRLTACCATIRAGSSAVPLPCSLMLRPAERSRPTPRSPIFPSGSSRRVESGRSLLRPPCSGLAGRGPSSRVDVIDEGHGDRQGRRRDRHGRPRRRATRAAGVVVSSPTQRGCRSH